MGDDNIIRAMMIYANCNKRSMCSEEVLVNYQYLFASSSSIHQPLPVVMVDGLKTKKCRGQYYFALWRL